MAPRRLRCVRANEYSKLLTRKPWSHVKQLWLSIELELELELYWFLRTLLQNCLPPLLIKRLIEAEARVTHLIQEKID